MATANPTWGSPRLVCHQALDMDCPESRPIQSRERGVVVEVTERDGLYRHYKRRAA
jgi:hypothetical protein